MPLEPTAQRSELTAAVRPGIDRVTLLHLLGPAAIGSGPGRRAQEKWRGPIRDGSGRRWRLPRQLSRAGPGRDQDVALQESTGIYGHVLEPGPLGIYTASRLPFLREVKRVSYSQ